MLEKEAYGIFWCVKKLDYFLAGNPFTVYTDHRSLTYVDSTVFSNLKVARWQSFLSDYCFTVQYIEGAQNVMADWLSRAHDFTKNHKPDLSCAKPKGRFWAIPVGGADKKAVSPLKIYIPSWVEPDVIKDADGRIKLVATSAKMEVNYASITPFAKSEVENSSSIFGPAAFLCQRQTSQPDVRVFDPFDIAFKQKQDPFLRKIIAIFEKPAKSGEERVSAVLSALDQGDDRFGEFKKAGQVFVP